MRKLVAVTAVLAVTLALALPVLASGGSVLPPDATPFGWSRQDMAVPVGIFNELGNNLACGMKYYPKTPFQVLWSPMKVGKTVDPNPTFVVGPNTTLYVPVMFQDDAPPWTRDGSVPLTWDEAVFNTFSPSQQGAHDVVIVVDGQVTPIGPEYLTTPAALPDGIVSYWSGVPAHYITYLGAFVAPLAPGTHTVQTSGVLDGALIPLFCGVKSVTLACTYTVIVR